MRKLIFLGSVCLLLGGSGALAHHPFDAEFDRSKGVMLTGMVESFDWMNPHASIHLNGRDQRGTEGEWTVELGGPDQLTRAGWTRETLKAGEKITVQGWMAKDGSKRVNARAVKTAAGKALIAASSFSEQDGRQLASDNPQGREAAGTSGQSGQLPRTATLMPLAGLVGLLSLGAAIALFAARR